MLPLEDESIVLALDFVVIDTKNWDVYGCSRKSKLVAMGVVRNTLKTRWTMMEDFSNFDVL